MPRARHYFLGAALFTAATLARAASVPAPADHLGFAPGDDFKLADSAQIFGYFRKLAAASDRIRLVEFGKTTLGKPMYVAFISAPDNLKHLDRYREMNRKLALGQATADEARRFSAESKAMVWIDSGLHASEVAPAQQAPELAYRLVSGSSPEMEAIRKNVILLQVPVINPDGLDMIAHWYMRNVGTPYELAPFPELYQKYSGHDNNRDWFMLNLQETRHVTRLLFREWFPQIVYNQHQAPPAPARIFVPPYAEPLNPNIPASVMEGINLIGAAVKERFALENKPGVLSYHGFDGWWNGGLRSVPAFHNMHGILTETAAGTLGTPRVIRPAEIRARFSNGIPAREPSVFYERPWMGGRWGVREAIDYMLTVDFAILELAAQRRSGFLLKSWTMARTAIEEGTKGHPFAYVLPPEQWDPPTATEMLDRLQQSGIEIRRSTAPFQAAGKQYPGGTYLLPAAQPFRAYLVDLMEPQKYPEIRSGSATAPIKRPYDITGWTLPMQMGVRVDRVDAPFEALLEPVASLPITTSGTLDHRQNAAFLTVADLLGRGERVRWTADGTMLTGTANGAAAWELTTPRLALYQPWVPNADEGWTEWLLDHYRVPYTLLHNDDFAKAKLRDRVDAVIFAQQSSASILNGVRHGEVTRPEGTDEPQVTIQRPEFTGGIGASGVAELQRFVSAGGTLIAFDTAAALAIEFLPLPVRNLVRAGADAEGASTFYAPGSLIRLTVDPKHPIAFGMPPQIIAMTTGGTAFDLAAAPQFNIGEHEVRSVARFATDDLLASGWASGTRAVLGKQALLEARYGAGKVVLFGFRPQFRGQPYGTFKLVLNAIYLASAKPL